MRRFGIFHNLDLGIEVAGAVEDAGLLDRDNLEGGGGEVHKFNLRVGAGAKAQAQEQGEFEFSHSYQR